MQLFLVICVSAVPIISHSYKHWLGLRCRPDHKMNCDKHLAHLVDLCHMTIFNAECYVFRPARAVSYENV